MFDQHPNPDEVVPMSRVNKYSYQVDENDKYSNDIVTFVPSQELDATTERQLETNEIPGPDNDLLSAVTMAGRVRQFRSGGYHSSTGPQDFMKKKYTSGTGLLEV